MRKRTIVYLMLSKRNNMLFFPCYYSRKNYLYTHLRPNVSLTSRISTLSLLNILKISHNNVYAVLSLASRVKSIQSYIFRRRKSADLRIKSKLKIR